MKREVFTFLREHTLKNPVTGCREFTGYLDRSGYGILSAFICGKRWKAHRYVWFLIHGGFEKPCVLHRCDNPPCCEPTHLWNGTDADNVADRDAKGRTSHVGCGNNPASGARHGSRTHPECLARGKRYSYNRGELNSGAKITRRTVDEIRKRASNRERRDSVNGPAALAKEFGLCRNQIANILSGRCW